MERGAVLSDRPGQFAGVRGYLWAAALTVLACLVRGTFPHLFRETPYLVFYPAVVAAAMTGGLRPGLLTTIAGTLCLATFFDDTPWRVDWHNPVKWLRHAVFIASGAGISLLAGRLHATLHREHLQLQEIARQKDLLAVTLASIGDAVIVTDQAGRVTFLNGEAQRLTGWSQEDAAGHPLPDVFHIVNEQTRQVVENPAEKVLRLGQVVGLANHTLLIARDGRETPIDDSGAPVRRADGGVLGVVLVFRDISVRKQAEQAAEQSRAKLEAALASMTDAVVITDAQGQIVDFNDAFAAYLRFGSKAECTSALARSPDILDVFMPDGIPVPIEMRAVPRALRGEAVTSAEYALRRSDTGQSWIGSCSFAPIRDKDGAIVGSVVVAREITAQKEAQAALRQSEARLARAQEIAHLGSWELDLLTNKLVWSDEAYRIFGLRPQEFSATYEAFLDAVHPDDRAAVNDAYSGSLRDNRDQYEIEHRVVRRGTGEVRIVHERCQHIRDAGGRIVRSLGMVHDITERKQAEEALRQSHRRMQKVLEVETVGVMFWDLTTGHMTDANDTFLKMMGYSRHDIEARRLTWQALTPPEYRDLSLAEIRKFHATGRVGPYEKEYFRKDGSRQWLVFAGSSLGNNACVEFCVDISDRKKAEAALRQREREFVAMFEGSAVAKAKADPESGRLVRVNQALADMTGYSRDELCAMTFADITHPDDRTRNAETLEPVRQGMASQWQIEKRYLCKDGAVIWVHVSGNLIQPDDGGPCHTIAVIQDITARKRAEEELKAATFSAQQARAAAEAASKAKDQFIATLSHELRTPLTPAAAAVSLLREDPRLPEDVREDLALAARNLDLEVRLIEDLLDVSRAATGKMHLQTRTVDVAAVIRDAGAVVSEEVAARGQTLLIESPGEPWLLCGDPARLQQAFWNLLRNASKFSPTGARLVVRGRVEAVPACPLVGPTCPIERPVCPVPPDRAGSQPRQNLVIDVIDPGCGIARENLSRLFEAFTQEDKARALGGLGLGLAICKAVVELHGGVISAHSDGPGHGATFTVRLPIAQCPLDQPSSLGNRSAVPDAAPDVGATAAPGLRIVLIEDHADTATLMKRLLARQGHQVTLAASVAEGVNAVWTGKPDLLISDLGLPDGSGLDVLRQLRERGRDLPAIALSGYGQEEDLRQSREAGFAEHLVKPIASAAILAAAIARMGIRPRQAGGDE